MDEARPRVFVETDEAENFRLTPEMIERQITPRTRAIIINTPNNPSGAVLNPADFSAILRLAHQRGIYVIADECYVYLNFTPRRFSGGFDYSWPALLEPGENVDVPGRARDQPPGPL